MLVIQMSQNMSASKHVTVVRQYVWSVPKGRPARGLHDEGLLPPCLLFYAEPVTDGTPRSSAPWLWGVHLAGDRFGERGRDHGEACGAGDR